MRPALAALVVVLASIAALHADNADDPGGRILRLERWLNAALAHHPGTKDDALNELALWSNADLRTLRVDEKVMVRLLRNPEEAIRVTVDAKAPVAPHTAWQRRRLRQLAEAYQKHDDHDDLIVRGAILHGDVAMATFADASTAPETVGDNIRVQTIDGEQVGFGVRPIHWEMARLLFDAIRPNGDTVARTWYIATSAWMQNREQHDTKHLRHAREMFPDDAGVLFFSGCQQETYAAPSIQALVRSVSLPTGYSVDVESESASLRDAESFFRRALARDPQLFEARMRLGHVLLARGRPQDAAVELRMLDAGAQPPPLQYFHAMFLGQAEEGVGGFEAAHDAYTRASSLFPGAQSPYLALSALATRRGDRGTALKETQRLFELPETEHDTQDPWWQYTTSQARDADELIAALYRSFDR